MPFDAPDAGAGNGSVLRRSLPSLVAALSVTWIALECFRPRGTNDVWWTLRVGDYIRVHGEVPRTTLWTMDAVRDLPYVCHGWLAALAYSGVKEAFGLDAVMLVPTVIALAVFALIVLLARRMEASWLLSLGIADLALWVAMPRMMCRAEVFGYLCFAAALNLLAAYMRTDRIRYLAWLLPLTVLWVNLHGSFLILLGLMPLFCAGLFLDAWRRSSFRGRAIVESLRARRVTMLFGAWLLVGVATLLNPYGLDLITSTLDQSTSQLWKQVIVEWQPLYERDFVPRRFIAAVSALAVAMAAGWRRLPFVSHLIALTLTALAVSSYRHLAVFGLGSAFVLARFAGGLKLERRLRPAVAVALIALLIGANAHAARVVSFADRSLERSPSRFVTRRGIDFIRRHVWGNVLNRWVLGGVLIYYAYPQVRVCIDSRADPYPASYFRAYRRAIAGTAKDTLGFVNRYGIDHIIIDQKLFDASFRAKLQDLEGFQPVFGDGKMVVLSREPRS